MADALRVERSRLHHAVDALGELEGFGFRRQIGPKHIYRIFFEHVAHELEGSALKILPEIAAHLASALRPAVVRMLGDHRAEVRIQALAANQCRLHEISNQKIVKDLP